MFRIYNGCYPFDFEEQFVDSRQLTPGGRARRLPLRFSEEPGPILGKRPATSDEPVRIDQDPVTLHLPD